MHAGKKSVGIYQRCRNHRRAEGNLAFHVHDRNRARILLKRSLPRFNDSIILRAERVSARGSQESVPYRRDMLVVVEGMRDMRAVRRAVDVDVYVLGSATRASDETVLKELERLGRRYRKIVLLLDADVAGRQARNVLDRVLQGCWHAFIPNEESTLMEQKDYKGVGDVGVEHASKQAIREGLSKIRRSNPDRKLFTREKLTSLKLIAPLHERGGSVTARRQLVCRFFGFGDCDGKQLLKQLNLYGFTEEELREALSWAEACIPDEINERVTPSKIKSNTNRKSL